MWKWLLAALAALAALSRVAWLAKFIPGIGPFAAVLSAVLDALMALVKWFFEGLTVIVKNPVTLVTVSVLCMVSGVGGIKAGIEWTDHLLPIEFAKGKAAGRIELAKEVNEASGRTVADADAGRAEVQPVPVDKVAIAALCAKSASCRDRGK